MPIIDLQRRMRQLGEIRIGHAIDTGRISPKTGKPILRPAKLSKFRLTSASKPLLEEVARLYGGEVQPWTPANGGPPEWEVYTETDRLPVLVPPREPVTQWYELYKGSKCVRRCDGQTEQKTDQPCMCDPERRDCQITTRLNIMLRDVPGLGVWLLTSHGYCAAVELPEIAAFLATTRGYVDAWLTMEEKQIVRDSGDVARFMVPKLDVAVTPAELLAGRGAVSGAAAEATAARAAVESGARLAIESAETSRETSEVSADTEQKQGRKLTPEIVLAAARKATTLKQWREIWEAAAAARVSCTPEQKAEMRTLGERLAKQEQEKPAAAPSGEPAVADELWQKIVAASPWGMSELRRRFLEASGGVAPEDASEAALDAFLKRLKAGESQSAQVERVPF
jgi:hypothetical protein